MFRSIGLWKLLAAPVAVPMALTLVVALAGPGGVFEPHQAPGQSAASHGLTEDAGASVAGVAAGDGGNPAGDVGAVVGADGAPAGAQPEGSGCVEALTEEATARRELEGLVADAGTSAGGADGIQQALDSQCGGALADGSSDTPPQPATPETPQGQPSGGVPPSFAGPPADPGQGAGASGNGSENGNGQDNAGGKPADTGGQ